MRPAWRPVVRNETLEEARARNIRDALTEDLGTGDRTAVLVPARPVLAQVRVREEAVLCGIAWFAGCVAALDPSAAIVWRSGEGDEMEPESVVCELQGDARSLLSAERSALNFLPLLSGTATATRRLVRAIADASPNTGGCLVLDTRKTIPGLRLAQKHAVRVGGGANQRIALWDGILLKENHITAAGGVAAAVRAALAAAGTDGISVQVEVESLDELRAALDAGAPSILLDDFPLERMREAVTITAGRALLEASGSVSEASIRAIAATGVDRISVGALTKHVRATDYSMRLVEEA
ncbi:MAG: carboxylating nicotinate-nucleotide diphosphorylase [Chloroflexota bacterium]